MPYAQRPYLWSEAVAEQLLEDLHTMACAEGGLEVEELPDYQLGTVNLLDKPAGAGPYTKKFVYDGQQRIVTLCLLLSALREQLEAAACGEAGLDDLERHFCLALAKSLARKIHQVGVLLRSQQTAGRCFAPILHWRCMRQQPWQRHECCMLTTNPAPGAGGGPSHQAATAAPHFAPRAEGACRAGWFCHLLRRRPLGCHPPPVTQHPPPLLPSRRTQTS